MSLVTRDELQETKTELTRDRAIALRAILRSPSYFRKLISYKWISGFYNGLDRFEIAKILGVIVDIDIEEKCNLTCSRVVDLTTGQPRSGLLDYFEEREGNYVDGKLTEEEFISHQQGMLINPYEVLVVGSKTKTIEANNE